MYMYNVKKAAGQNLVLTIAPSCVLPCGLCVSLLLCCFADPSHGDQFRAAVCKLGQTSSTSSRGSTLTPNSIELPVRVMFNGHGSVWSPVGRISGCFSTMGFLSQGLLRDTRKCPFEEPPDRTDPHQTTARSKRPIGKLTIVALTKTCLNRRVWNQRYHADNTSDPIPFTFSWIP